MKTMYREFTPLAISVKLQSIYKSRAYKVLVLVSKCIPFSMKIALQMETRKFLPFQGFTNYKPMQLHLNNLKAKSIIYSYEMEKKGLLLTKISARKNSCSIKKQYPSLILMVHK